MEKHVGRFISVEEEIHHKNEIKTDNRIENLEIFTHSEHMHRHNRSPEARRKISEGRKRWWANLKKARGVLENTQEAVC